MDGCNQEKEKRVLCHLLVGFLRVVTNIRLHFKQIVHPQEGSWTGWLNKEARELNLQ